LPEPQHTRSGPHPGTPFTILIVEDDASLRAALESVFAPLGYRVLTAADGDAAYAFLASEPADAVLLDVRLPGMSGLALYLAIVHRWPRLEGRIAFMSGDADAPDVRSWLARGRYTMFRKPFSFRQIVDWLAVAVRAPDRTGTQGRA
jgi:DNA-binding response OmpR family regulator